MSADASGLEETRKLDRRIADVAKVVGNLLTDAFHYVLLFAIGAAVVWSALSAVLDMISAGVATIDDILLLFIYLELGAMVSIYFKTYRMPVRFLLYVSITALTRVLLGVINAEHEHPDETLLYVTSAILIVSAATVLIRFGSYRYPSSEPAVPSSEPAAAKASRDAG